MSKIKMMITLTLCILTLAACGKKAPNFSEVEQAIASGYLTVEDALDQGLVSQEWYELYLEENSIDADNKIDTNAFGVFKTTTLSGDVFTSAAMEDVTYWAFLDDRDAGCEAFYSALKENYKAVKELGVEVLITVKPDAPGTLFEDAPFPVILWNDSLAKATEKYQEMIEDVPNIGVWCIHGAAISAWNGAIDENFLVSGANTYAKMFQETQDTEGLR